MKLRILTTGGTIDKVYFDALSQFQVGDSLVPEVLRQAHVVFNYELTRLLRKDSTELTPEDLQLIRQTIEEDTQSTRFLITHGTDLMPNTGQFLKGIRGKTIVLTGSLSPVRFRESDAIFNLGFAVAAVQLLPEGVYLAMNGQIWDPAVTRKNREANRYETIAG